jgi:hypothetical protein
MKFYLLILFAFVSFNSSERGSKMNGKWKLFSYGEIENQIEKPVDSKQIIIINFKDDYELGHFYGTTEKNKFYGDYYFSQTLESESRRLAVKRYETTKVKEYGWAVNFGRYMRRACDYKNSGDTLFVYYNTKTAVLKFLKEN